MPSVPAASGRRSAPRPCGIHGSPGGASAVKSGRCSAAHASMSTVSSRVSVHTEYTSMPPGRTIVGGRRRAARVASAASSGIASGSQAPAGVGSTAEHTDAAARARRAAPGRTCRCRRAGRGRRPRRTTTFGRSQAGDRFFDEADAPGVDVDGDHLTVVTDLLGDRGGLAAGGGGEIGDALARLRVEHRDDGLAALVLRCGAAVAHCGQPRRVTDAPDHERRLDEPARLDLAARARDLGADPARVAAARVHPQRDGRGLVHRHQRGVRALRTELGGETLDQPVGVRERDRLADRLRVRRPEAGDAAQHTVGEPARAASGPRAPSPSPRRPRARAHPARVGTHPCAARRAPAGRAA